MVRIRLGPLPAASAQAWLDYATRVLEAIRAGSTAPDVTISDEEYESFREYLASWQDATVAEPFRWERVEDPERIRMLSARWLEVTALLSGRWDEFGLPEGPPEGEPFYHGLVEGISDALNGRDVGPDRFGDKLAEAWPALGEVGTPAAPSHPEPPSGFDRCVRLVVVDDTDDMRVLFRVALTSDGRFDVVGEAADGAQALEVVAVEQPDVVLLDLMMPVMDGWEALPKLREISPDTRIVVISAMPSTGNADRALSLGASRYLEKTVSLNELADALVEVALAGATPA